MTALAASEAFGTIAFLWDNFGPTHADRIDALARDLEGVARCLGVEERATPSQYDWIGESRDTFEKVTLTPEGKPKSRKLLGQLIALDRARKPKVWFLCNYDRKHVFFFALWLRARGRRVFLMGDSKFDDFKRRLGREVLKSLTLRPYCGALACGVRSQDYMRFLLGPGKPVECEYDTLSLARIRRLAGVPPAPGGIGFAERDFLIVARLIEKKNLFMALEAFARFRALTGARRRLRICGSGPLEAELRARAEALGLGAAVLFEGFVQTAQVAQFLGRSLALILPSTEEQFGLVTIEAQAMGLPVLLSEACGARDALVRNWQNGFIFEPDNPDGLARFMALIDADEPLWRSLCEGATANAALGDVSAFVRGVRALTNLESAAHLAAAESRS